MNDSLQAQVETYLSHLDDLIHRGEQLGEALAANPADGSVIAANRAWQEECGVTINQLSGGSKAHWLARAFSQAFLVRSESGSAIEGVAPEEIVQRLIDVLKQAVAVLSQGDQKEIVSASLAQPAPHRFDFVHNSEIRAVLERTYIDGRLAFDAGQYYDALLNYCGILEAIVTDALEHKGPTALLASGAPPEKISQWSFETRLTVAERAGLIRGGSTRLPAVARSYRDHSETEPRPAVSEREARLASQVLHVIMKDLDPGR
jgi:hypothetical protein